jgi:hypothetical protein
MNDFVECKNCGTLYHLNGDVSTAFACTKCRKKVQLKRSKKIPTERKTIPEERLRKFQDRLSRGIFLMGSTVGLFVLLLMIPTAIYFKDPGVTFLLMVIELVLGTLLVCSSIAFYLLSIQVFSLQALLTFQQHNLAIFHDQIARLFGMFRRKE